MISRVMVLVGLWVIFVFFFLFAFSKFSSININYFYDKIKTLPVIFFFLLIQILHVGKLVLRKASFQKMQMIWYVHFPSQLGKVQQLRWVPWGWYWLKSPNRSHSWYSRYLFIPHYICPLSGIGGLWFQDNIPIPKDQIYFAILYNNIFPRHTVKTVSVVEINLTPVQSLSPWRSVFCPCSGLCLHPCPKDEILCFPQGQLLSHHTPTQTAWSKAEWTIMWQNRMFFHSWLLRLVSIEWSPTPGPWLPTSGWTGFSPQPVWWH